MPRVEGEYTCYTRTGRCLAQSSFLASLDWSEDSQYIQVGDTCRESSDTCRDKILKLGKLILML